MVLQYLCWCLREGGTREKERQDPLADLIDSIGEHGVALLALARLAFRRDDDLHITTTQLGDDMGYLTSPVGLLLYLAILLVTVVSLYLLL